MRTQEEKREGKKKVCMLLAECLEQFFDRRVGLEVEHEPEDCQRFHLPVESVDWSRPPGPPELVAGEEEIFSTAFLPNDATPLKECMFIFILAMKNNKIEEESQLKLKAKVAIKPNLLIDGGRRSRN
jgi:hypothetical protein